MVCSQDNDWNCSSSGRGQIIDPNAITCRGTTRAANYRTKGKTEKQCKGLTVWGGGEMGRTHTKTQWGAVRLSDLIVAVARPLLAANPALAALLAASPRPTLDTNVRVLEGNITMDGGHVATEVMLAREGTSAGWMQTHVGLGPVGVVGLPVGFQIEGPGEGYETNESETGSRGEDKLQY